MSARTPLDAEHQAAGARMGEAWGWRLPLDFGDPSREYAALRSGAGLVDLSAHGKLRVTGADRARFLHNLLSNDIQALAPGSGCYAAKLTVHGKMEAAVVVLCLEDEIRCLVEPGPAPQVFAALRKHLVRDKAGLEDVTAAWGLITVQGPGAEAVLGAAGVETQPLAQALQHAATSIGEIAVRVVRADRCGAGGFDLWVPAEEAPRVWAKLRTDGGAVPAGLQALDVRRIEAGIPWAGTEIDGETFPMEAGLDAGWISYTKGCYLGQETISRIHHLGHVNRVLGGLKLDGDALPPPRAKVTALGKPVGWVTSAALSPALGQPVALAYVNREFAAPETEVTVEVSAGQVTSARVAPLPLA